MALTLAEVKATGRIAQRPFWVRDDELGDTHHGNFYYLDGVASYVAVTFNDGGIPLIWPLEPAADGWLHEEECDCELSPRCRTKAT